MTDTNPHDDIERLSLHLRDCVQKADSNWAYVNIDVLLDAAEYLERFAQPEPEGPTDETPTNYINALHAARRPEPPMTELSPAAQATYDAFNRIGLYNEPSLKMTNQITLDEALKLVDFDQLQNGQWYVKTVKGNCITVQGYCEVIYGNVHTVEGRVVATINGREWQYVDDPRERVARLLKEGAPKEELLEALEQLDG